MVTEGMAWGERTGIGRVKKGGVREGGRDMSIVGKVERLSMVVAVVVVGGVRSVGMGDGRGRWGIDQIDQIDKRAKRHGGISAARAEVLCSCKGRGLPGSDIQTCMYLNLNLTFHLSHTVLYCTVA